MMKYSLVTIALFAVLFTKAQDVSLALQKESPLSDVQKAAAWNALKGAIHVSFASSNRRYAQDRVPAIAEKSSQILTAWKGEKVHTQLAVWTAKDTKVNIAVADLTTKNGAKISKENISAGFVGYLMTDEYRDGCGYRKPADFDSSLVGDIINTETKNVVLQKNHVQPLWVSIDVPAGAKAGLYTGTITINADKVYKLILTLNVVSRLLPPPSQWTFSLDLWQHPAAIARVHNVPLWSDAHFALMKKYYTMLARAGQKYITASIVNEPWGHQTYDDFPSLIKWTKKKDGSWIFDYSLFDKYVSFVMGTGINQRINCYSMVPWKIAFQYYDEALGRDTIFTGAIGTDAYNAHWTPMLTDFTRHLKAKGWFDKTTIAMDERPMEAMQAVIRLLKGIDRDWKIALAGNYHAEIEKDVHDYCIASAQQFPDKVLAERSAKHQVSTWYTCCTEKYPNGFTFSPPAEHVWVGWYTAAKNMNGYLRWAYNSWTADPLHDSRFRTWPAGDTYQVYPGPLSSVRFEKMIEGVQDFEKIRILRQQYKVNGQLAKAKALEGALGKFEIGTLAKQSAEEMVEQVKPLLNR